jgi:hypothetical protein
MVQESAETRPEHLGADATATISLGKGAWDCDKGVAISPEKEVDARLQQPLVRPLGWNGARLSELCSAGAAGRGLRGDRQYGLPLRGHTHSAASEGHGPHGDRLALQLPFDAHSVQLYVSDSCITVHTGLDVTQVWHNSQVSSPSAQVFFCSGCRYRVTAYREWTAAQVRTPWQGGLALRSLCRPSQHPTWLCYLSMLSSAICHAVFRVEAPPRCQPPSAAPARRAGQAGAVGRRHPALQQAQGRAQHAGSAAVAGPGATREALSVTWWWTEASAAVDRYMG